MTQNNQSRNFKFDCLILGGGLVGLAAANACAKMGLSVALIDSRDLNTWGFADQARTPDWDLRSYALMPKTIDFLKSLNSWTCSRYGVFKKIQVRENQSNVCLDYDAREHGLSELGCIVEHRLLGQGLYQALQDLKYRKINHNITEYIGQALNIIQTDFGVELELKLSDSALDLGLNSVSRVNLQGACLIAADGAHSWVRHYLGQSGFRYDYHQSSIVSTVTVSEPHQYCAYQRFLKTGPVALLPLAELHKMSLVWTTTDPHAKDLLTCSESEFCRALSLHSDCRFGVILACDRRQVFKLHGYQAKNYFDRRVVWLGDSAHQIHPLAGQGLNLGLQDVQFLISEFEKIDLWDPVLLKTALQNYQAARKWTSWGYLVGLEGIRQWFHYILNFNQEIASGLGWVTKQVNQFGVKSQIRSWLKNEI